MKKLTLSGQTINQLIIAENEMDVTNSYRQFITRRIPDIVFTSPYQCDGYGVSEKHKIRLLCEFKYNYNFTKKSDWVQVLCQAIFYIKKFEQNATMLPNVIMLGDNNEWLVFHVNDIFEYLNLDIDWTKPPSKAFENKELFNLIFSDKKLNPYVFTIDELDEMTIKIKSLVKNIVRQIPITKKNITDVFMHFLDKVLSKNTVIEEGSKTLTVNETVNLFVQIIINPTENYIHPEKVNTLATKAFGDIKLPSSKTFEAFFQHFSRKYKPKEKEILTSIIDRLIEDITRRKQGEFFTPTIWVDKAHEYITSVYGEDWKEKYIVWDPAWGTGNLTRDYKFKELYVSTLNYSDIQTAVQIGYNPEAIKFQFDFLNDGSNLLPEGLKDAIKTGKEILILLNAPYATSSNMIQGTSKKGVGFTKMNKEMNDKKLGRAASQLYAQFFYRLNKFKNVKICMFTKPTFMTGQVYKEFRNQILNNYEFKTGFVMDAKDFDGVKSWPLTFTIWDKTENNTNKQINNNYKLDILKKENYELCDKIVNSGNKIFYNTDKLKPLNRWLKDSVKKKKTFDAVQLSSALVVKPKGYGRLTKDAIGYLLASQNIPQSNQTMNAVFTSAFSAKNGISITKENLDKCVVHFAVRKLINSDWLNEKDEYLAPDESKDGYETFKNDAFVHFLFNSASEQSSLRHIFYKEKFWDIKNEFFWVSKEEMMGLANDYNFTELWNDAKIDENRHMYNILFGEENIYNKLSPDAKLVIDKAKTLVRISMGLRKEFKNHTNHLSCWDAGYAQLKLLWQTHFPEEFKEFRQLYKNLEDRMRPLVYQLGFLLK